MRVLVNCLIPLPLLIVGCTINNSKVRDTTAFNLEKPIHFSAPEYQSTSNFFTKSGYILGEKLFNDPRLSVNNNISCASCHKQKYAFSDAGNALSTGIYDRKSDRNAPPIFNVAWNKTFMWDGGVNHIEVMPLAPLTNHAEMGETIEGIIAKLKSDQDYQRMFKAAFGKDSIDDQQMFYALAQFMSHLVSSNSKYDKYITGSEIFTSQEIRGLQLFRQKCSNCHTEPLFTNFSYRNNGLYLYYKDSGRYRITKQLNDLGKFKVPSLRNIAVTYPYMHDGSLSTLEDVLEHYSQNMQLYVNLDSVFIQNKQTGIPLTDKDKENILIFLHTLTDSVYLQIQL